MNLHEKFLFYNKTKHNFFFYENVSSLAHRSINKDQFQRKKNDTLDPELYVPCFCFFTPIIFLMFMMNELIWI